MDILFTFLGAVIAIITTVIVESLRQPKLQIRLSKIGEKEFSVPHPAKKIRSLYLELINQSFPKGMGWLTRTPALQCHGTITFYHLDGQDVFGRSMQIRWTNLPNPIPININVGNKIYPLFDPAKFNHATRVDVYPGGTESERFNVASRFDDENDCYGWCNENLYKEPLWRNLDWKLPSGRYLVKVVITSSAKKVCRLFRLINDVSMSDFRLENALPTDKVFDI
jgi:hypothetical protein